jgi:hypothetical protein
MLSIPIVTLASEMTMVEHTGIRKFGPDMTENEACQQAFEKAKQNALVSRYGEQRGSSTVLACDSVLQRTTGNDCEIYETTWSLIGTNGFIRDTTVIDQEIRDVRGARECRMQVRVSIQDFDGEPDPAFESKISLHRKVLERTAARIGRFSQEPTINFKPGELAVIQISSSQKAYHYVFFWAPDVQKSSYQLLYPNDYDLQKEPTSQLTIPTTNASTEWDIEIQLESTIQYSHEYLMVVSTKDPIAQPPLAISEHGFYQWLSNQPRNEWTLAKYSYRVIGDIL